MYIRKDYTRKKRYNWNQSCNHITLESEWESHDTEIRIGIEIICTGRGIIYNYVSVSYWGSQNRETYYKSSDLR